MTSYEGMKAEATAAREAAEAAAASAAASADAPANSAALVGAPADIAIAAAINGSATATKTALSATFAPTSLVADVATKAKLTSLVRPGATFRTSNPVRTSLGTFQAGHGYTQAGASSFSYNDTTDYVMDSPSAYIVAGGAGVQAILTKSAAVTSLNMTGKVFAILVKVTNSAHLSRLTLIAGDSGFANNFQLQVQSSLTRK